jgi:hypothetical protein
MYKTSGDCDDDKDDVDDVDPDLIFYSNSTRVEYN